MAGLYEIHTRAPGTLITALIYNSDHQNHVDGPTADLMQSLGSSVSQMNLIEKIFIEAGPAGAEPYRKLRAKMPFWLKENKAQESFSGYARNPKQHGKAWKTFFAGALKVEQEAPL